MKIKLISTLLLFIFFALSAQSQDVFLVKNKQESTEIAKEYFEMFHDIGGDLTIEKILFDGATTFNSFATYQENLYQDTDYWLKLKVKNVSNKNGEWTLEFREIPYLDIFIVDEKNEVEKSGQVFLFWLPKSK